MHFQISYISAENFKKKSVELLIPLTHFQPVLHFYTTWKHLETAIICSANQWTGFYMITVF